jgi:hypothetical protein
MYGISVIFGQDFLPICRKEWVQFLMVYSGEECGTNGVMARILAWLA